MSRDIALVVFVRWKCIANICIRKEGGSARWMMNRLLNLFCFAICGGSPIVIEAAAVSWMRSACHRIFFFFFRNAQWVLIDVSCRFHGLDETPHFILSWKENQPQMTGLWKWKKIGRSNGFRFVQRSISLFYFAFSWNDGQTARNRKMDNPIKMWPHL